MKKLIILLMIVTGMSVQAEEILKKEEKVNTENTNYIPEPPMSTQINFGFPTCIITDGKCVVHGFKVDGEKINKYESYDLKNIVKVLNVHIEKGSLEIIGHTDSTGSQKHNLKLSETRAKNFARLMREFGLDKRFSFGKIKGEGANSPVDTDDRVEGRYNNRRVEILLNNVEFENQQSK